MTTRAEHTVAGVETGIVIRLQLPAPSADPCADWQADAVCDGRRITFPSLLALIRWLASLDPRGGGIR
jgi:hypothetical protein